MNRRVIISFLLTVLLCVAVSPTSASGTTVKLSTTTPKQGDVVRVSIKDEHACRVQAKWANDTFPIRPSRPRTNKFTGLLGIDVTETAGPKTLRFRLDHCAKNRVVTTSREIIVQENDFKTQHLTIADKEKVTLSETNLKRVYREKQRIRNALSESSATKYWFLPFTDPVNGIEPGNSFGSRRIINGKPRSPHSGEDYSADTGELVRSIAAGNITLTGNFFFSGRSVFIDHGTGFHSMYFHLSRINVEEGQFVREGQAIGEAGMSGRTTGPHLHLGVKISGATVDPDHLLEMD